MRDGTAGGDDVDLSGVRGLRRGDEGAEVEELQLLLNRQGGTLVVDGDFGDRTEDTLRNYQLHMGCAPTLIADPGTMCLLAPREQGPDVAALRHQIEGLRAHVAASHRDARSTVMQTTAALETVQSILDDL
jgi:peptidoglycan hydrolase-like protein with peptidoglycan-binding domain